MKKFKILDLFCGAGGFSHGMHKNTNFETLVAVDFNSYATETLNGICQMLMLLQAILQMRRLKDK